MSTIVRAMFVLTAPVFCQTSIAPSFINEATINAPVAVVWNVWTSGEAYKSLGVAQARWTFELVASFAHTIALQVSSAMTRPL